MSGNISLTASMRSNLLSLQNISRTVGATQNKLATGNKVNSAIDNPSSYYTARSLNNRANDLDALLDSMGQAVSTIKTATTALETGATFLEQAAAVATSALETAKIPSKEWFESQDNVSAVVSNWSELKAALDSGKAGNIVIYGNITAESTIILQAGQNLVGVGYYGVSEPDTDKFSQISIDFTELNEKNAISVLGENHMFSDLSIHAFASNGPKNEVITAYGASGDIVWQNMDMVLDNSKSALCSDVEHHINGIGSGNYLMRGINNFYSPTKDEYYVQTIVNSKITLEDGAVLNMEINDKQGRVFAGTTINTFGSSRINAYGGGNALESSYLYMHDDSVANLQGSRYATLSLSREVSLDDRAKLNIFGATSSSNTQDRILNLTINSADVELNLFSEIDFEQANILLSTVKGAKLSYKGEVFESQSISNETVGSKAEFWANFTKTAETKTADVAIADILAKQNSERQTEYNYNNSTAEQGKAYTGILNQYDTLVKDSSYKGVNLLKNEKLNVRFNEKGDADLNVNGKDMSAGALGLNTIDWQNQGDIAQSLKEIAGALKSIRAFTAELGNNYSIITNRQEFTENLINILTEGADKLTLADMNEESANMLSLQTRQQLAINSLSLASQAAQAVLKLF